MRSTSCAILVSALLLGACQSTPPISAYPALELLDAAPLTLANDCAAAATGSFIVEFTVETTGRATDIRPPEAPSCVREALSAWVASFRYAPPTAATPGSIEWLLTTAKRGS